MSHRLLASAALCALLTVTPSFNTGLDHISASDELTALPKARDNGLRNAEFASVARIDVTPVSTGAQSSAPIGRAGDDSQDRADMPRNRPIPVRHSVSALIGSPGADVEAAIGAAADANLVTEDEADDAPRQPLTREATCTIVNEVAEENALPQPLFARLIWQESRFKADAVSPVGAQGIAQFMPATAAERGLEDPFDPLQALPASAAFLRDLMRQFGNFGLAAAAYNGGPGRVGRWLAGKGGLPEETRNYVIQITGRTAEHWALFAAAEPHPEAIEVADCEIPPLRVALAEAREEEKRRKVRETNAGPTGKDGKNGSDDIPLPAERPRDNWIASLSGNWSEKRARAMYASLQKKYPKVLGRRAPTVRVKRVAGKKAPKTIVGVAADTRAEAQVLCQRLKQAGGACVVQKDPS